MSEAKTCEPTEEQKARAHGLCPDLRAHGIGRHSDPRYSCWFCVNFAKALAEESSREKARADGLAKELEAAKAKVIDLEAACANIHDNLTREIDGAHAERRARVASLEKQLADKDTEERRMARQSADNRARADAAEKRLREVEEALRAARKEYASHGVKDAFRVLAHAIDDTLALQGPSGAPPAQPPAAAPVASPAVITSASPPVLADMKRSIKAEKIRLPEE